MSDEAKTVVLLSAHGVAVRTADGKLNVRGDGLMRIPVIQEGPWVKGTNEIPITPAMVGQMRANFAAGAPRGPVPISYEHTIEHPERAMGQPIPAAGWLREIEASADADGVTWGWAAPTKRALEMIEGGEYEFTSPAYSPRYPSHRTGKDQGATLFSLALTNRPFLLTPPITMSVVLAPSEETELTAYPAQAGKEKTMKKVRVSAITDGDNKGNLQIEHADLPGKTESGGGYFADAGETRAALADTREHSASGEAIAKVVMLSGVSGATELSPLVVDALAQRVAAGASRPAVLELSAVPLKDGRRDYLAVAVPAGAVVSGELMRTWQADIELDAAVGAGKVLPAQREEFARIASRDIDLFRVMVNAMRPQVQLSVSGTGGDGGGTVELSAEENSVAKQLGMDPAKVLEDKKRRAGGAV